MQEFNKELLKGYIDNIILSVLKEKEMYGYEMTKKIKEISQDLFEIKEATLYVSLKRLEKKKLLEGYWNDDMSTGGGRRRYYRITKEGCKELKLKKSEWVLLKKVLNNFMGD